MIKVLYTSYKGELNAMRELLHCIPIAIAFIGLCLMLSGKYFCQKGTDLAKAIFWWSYSSIIVGATIQVFLWASESEAYITGVLVTAISAFFLGGFLSWKETSTSYTLPKSLIFWAGAIACITLFFCMMFAGKEISFPQG